MGDLLNNLTGIGKNLLVFIGVLGGLVYWWDRFQNRSRLKLHSWDETLLDEGGKENYIINIEIESFGTKASSLEKYIIY